MDPRFRPARRLLPLVAVAAIAAASVLPAAAAAPTGAAPAGAPATTARAEGRTAGTLNETRRSVRRAPASTSAAVRVSHPLVVAPPAIDLPAAAPRVESKAVASASGGSTSRGSSGGSSGGAYRGRNHVWIPGLGLSRGVDFYACNRSTALAHVVYRWGCGGTNNVYLMGHASSVFKPLHDLYVSGRLRKGMQVTYADGNGRVRTYSVSFWKVVAPDGDVAWAYAAQARPSMTLQTCIGASSQWRLVVRLVQTG